MGHRPNNREARARRMRGPADAALWRGKIGE